MHEGWQQRTNRVLKDFESFEDTNKALQRDDMTIAMARTIMRTLVRRLVDNYALVPSNQSSFLKSVVKQIDPDQSDHVLFPLFEEAVAKLQHRAKGIFDEDYEEEEG